MPTKEIAQHYVVEVAARARTVQSRCARLTEEEYFSAGPHVFATTISRMCDFLGQAAVAIYDDIDWDLPEDEIEEDLKVLRTADYVVKFIAGELRYIEGARTERLPWSIITSFEKLVAEFLPGIQIMLRAKWRYNYEFHIADQGAIYKSVLQQFQEYVPGVDIERDIFSEMRQPFHIISFPSLEQKHILLHCLLGHEIGHLLVDKFITTTRTDALVNSVLAEVTQAVDDNLASLPATVGADVRKLMRDPQIATSLRETLNLWTRGLEELLSDAAGVFLFGPAMLLSMLDLAIQGDLDTPPSADSQYYPPWRMRLRRTLALLDAAGEWFPVSAPLFNGNADRARLVNDRVAFVRATTAITSDVASIESDRLTQIAYRELESALLDGHAFLLNDCKLGLSRPSAADTYGRIPALITRLDQQIPPNAFEVSPGVEQVASFADIVNAAWLQKISIPAFDDGRFSKTSIEVRNLMNNLTLKAIEYAHLSREYQSWTLRPR